MLKKIVMNGLICTTCIAKIEKHISFLNYVKSTSFNFNSCTMLVDFEETDFDKDKYLEDIKNIVNSVEHNIETYYFEEKPQNTNEKRQQVKKYFPFFIGIILLITATSVRNNWFNNTFFVDNIFTTIGYYTLYWIGYIFVAFNIMKDTVLNIKRKDFISENTLMFLATVAAMSLNEFLEAYAVIILFTLGEYLQHKAVFKSRKDINSLLTLQIEYANLIDNNIVRKVDPIAIKIGDTILVKNGERVPVDGIIIKGSSAFNTSAITGESKPSELTINNKLLSGYVNEGEAVTIEAKKIYGESALSKIIDFIGNASNEKAKTEEFITKFAKIYTPAVVVLAILLFSIPSFFDSANYQEYLYRAASFLVISCPCALVLSIPLSYFSGLGAAARHKILFKSSTHLHQLSYTKNIAIDKTGTLTKGVFAVTYFTNKEVLKVASSIENYSNHPIAKSVIKYYEGEIYTVDSAKEIPGYGLEAVIEGHNYLCGSIRLLEQNNIIVNEEKDLSGSNIFIAKDNEYLGHLVVKDEIKPSAYTAMSYIKKKYKVTMLTGDNDHVAKDIADSIGGIDYYADLLPEDKTEVLSRLKGNGIKVFVGDGINDVPVLNSADIGIAMGSGSDAAIDFADIIILNDDLETLATAFKISEKTKRIVFQNIMLAIVGKLIFLFLAAMGISAMWMAIIGDVGITLIAIMNSLRIIYSKKELFSSARLSR